MRKKAPRFSSDEAALETAQAMALSTTGLRAWYWLRRPSSWPSPGEGGTQPGGGDSHRGLAGYADTLLTSR